MSELPALRFVESREPREREDVYEGDGPHRSWNLQPALVLDEAHRDHGRARRGARLRRPRAGRLVSEDRRARPDRVHADRPAGALAQARRRAAPALAAASGQLPELSPQTIELIFSRSPTGVVEAARRVPDRARGRGPRHRARSPPAEAEELRALSRELLGTLSRTEAERVREYDRTRSRRVIFPFENPHVMELVARGARARCRRNAASGCRRSRTRPSPRGSTCPQPRTRRAPPAEARRAGRRRAPVSRRAAPERVEPAGAASGPEACGRRRQQQHERDGAERERIARRDAEEQALRAAGRRRAPPRGRRRARARRARGCAAAPARRAIGARPRARVAPPARESSPPPGRRRRRRGRARPAAARARRRAAALATPPAARPACRGRARRAGRRGTPRRRCERPRPRGAAPGRGVSGVAARAHHEREARGTHAHVLGERAVHLGPRGLGDVLLRRVGDDADDRHPACRRARRGRWRSAARSGPRPRRPGGRASR